MKILIITGPPYSGKGTQCEILKDQLDFKHVSTGDRCRIEKENKTKIGLTIAKFEEQGDLVPDTIMKSLFSEILDNSRAEKGIILDGYPRTKAQVDDLLELIASKDLEIWKVLNIDVPKAELLRRAKKRAETSDRKDDQDASVHIKRIEIFESSTKPGIEYMKSKLSVQTFDGLGTIAEISNRIQSSLG